MREKLLAMIAEELGLQEEDGSPKLLPTETSFDELGLDSLEFVDLMQKVGREIGDVPEEKWVEIETIADLIAAIEACAPAAAEQIPDTPPSAKPALVGDPVSPR